MLSDILLQYLFGSIHVRRNIELRKIEISIFLSVLKIIERE